MKKLFLSIAVIVSLISQAQDVQLDSSIRYGKLENGLTYYIKHNEEPKERVSFYMVQKVGAILENDSQNGLAHFLEHMAFNGTKHFPKKQLLDFLQRHGVAFGADINAYTATDETVYNLSDVPSTKAEVLDSCLLILHDWSNYLLLTDDEIDSERGVISEEWRTRRTAQFRMRKKQNEVLLAGSKYGVRDVIGDLDIIQNFPYETLRDYYKTWYRTDLQGLVIVGDMDVDLMEAKVKKLFSKIPAAVNPREREYFDLPKNKEPRYVVVTDKEASSNYIYLQFNHQAPRPETKGQAYLRDLYARNLFLSMISNRVQEKLQEEKPPFIVAQIFFQDHLPTALTASMYIMHKPEGWQDALTEALRIVENVKDHGFTKSELSRAKVQLLSGYEDAFKKQDKRSSNSFAMEIKDHFVKNEPTPGIESELNYLKANLESISEKEVSQWAETFLTDENVLIAVAGPEEQDAAYPTKEEVLQVLTEVKRETAEAYIDGYKERDLIDVKPTAGNIVKRKDVKRTDAKVLTLSNGIKVYIQPSKLEKDKVLLNAFSYGGSSLLAQDRLADAEMLGEFINAFGISDFTAIELGKVLTGKIVSLNMNVGQLSEGMSGSASPKDLETLFQLVYLSFESPRFDEQSFNALKSRYMDYVKNLSNDANRAFNDSITLTMANHHPRVLTLGEEMVNDVSFQGIRTVYKERFGDPGDFYFVVSGNFDEAALEDYIKTYLGSLSVVNKKEKFVDQGIRTPAVDTENQFTKKLTVEKATVYVNMSKEMKYSQKDAVYMYVISKLLDKRYLEEIREKEGGTYGVGVAGSFRDEPYDQAQLRFKFDCAAENMSKLKGIALAEVEALIGGKVNASELEDIKSNVLKVRAEELEKLGFWHRRLLNYGKKGELKMSNEQYVKFIKGIQPKTIAKQAKKLLNGSVKVEVIMLPE